MESVDEIGITAVVVDEEAKIKTADVAVEACQAEKGADMWNSAPVLSKTEEMVPFDMLRFKDNFFEVVEELRFRRVQDSENLRRIQELLSEKHKLMQKLDEMKKKCESLTEEHKVQQSECVKKHKEEVRQHNNEQIKSNLMKESREKELKSLKDEMRALHLTNHNLEKRVQELERQLQLQNSSKENHLNKMAQLEEKCGLLFSLAEQVKEQIERLENNVKQAGELQSRLEYVNNHKKCEMVQLQEKLDSSNHELVLLRAQSHDKKCTSVGSGIDAAAKLKSAEQELKMQSELCKQVQDELTSLRLEHQRVLQQLREAHSLLEKHVEHGNKLSEREEQLKAEMEGLKVEIENLKADLIKIQDEHESQRASHAEVTKELEQELGDTKQRLRTLQADFKGLQDSFESLESSNKSLLVEHELQVQKLSSHNEQLENEQTVLVAENEVLKERSSLSSKQIESCQSALDQSEVELLELKNMVQEKDRLITQIERINLYYPMNSQVNNHTTDNNTSNNASQKFMAFHSSPEVISDTDAPVPNGMGSTMSKGEENSNARAQSDSIKYQDSGLLDPNVDLFPSLKRQKLESLSTPEGAPAMQAYLTLCNFSEGSNLESSQLLPLEESNVKGNRDIKPGVNEIEDSPPLPVSELKLKINKLEVEKHKEQEIDSVDKIAGKVDLIEDGKQEVKVKPEERAAKIEMLPEDEAGTLVLQSSGDSCLNSPVTKMREESTTLDFSPDEKSHQNILMSTQINKQIEKVEKFLKTDRLRRKRDTFFKFPMD